MKLAKIIKYALTIIILSSLQVSLCQHISVFDISPNLTLAFVVAVSVINGPLTGGVVGFVCGIFMDSLCSGTSVLYTLTYTYIAVICGVINLNFLRKNAGVAILFTFIATIVCEQCIHFFHYSIWGVTGLFSGLVYPILPTAVYSTILSVPIYYLTKLLFDNNKEIRRDYI